MTAIGSPTLSAFTPPSDLAGLNDWLDAQIALVQAGIESTLQELLRTHAARFLDANRPMVVVADASGEEIAADWAKYSEVEIGPALGGIYRAGALTSWVGATHDGLRFTPTAGELAGWNEVIHQQAVDYMAAATNRVVGLADPMWVRVQTSISASLADGKSTEAIKGDVEALTAFTEFRADTIARTEVVGAYSNGDRAGAVALGDHGPVEHSWMATGGARTRESHAEADGQTVGFDEPFIVGGERLMFPHDPSGSPENVVNCRCVAADLYPGDSRPDGSTVPEPEPAPELPEQDQPAVPEVTVAERQKLSAGHPDVIAVAQRFGVSPDEVMLARGRVGDVKAVMREQAARTQLDAVAEMDRLGAVKVKSPPRLGARSDTGRVLRHGGEYDFLEQLSRDETRRLANWYGGTEAPDQIAATMSHALNHDVSTDEAMARWLELNRTADAAGAVRRGKLPSLSGYSNAISLDSLVPGLADEGFDVALLLDDPLVAAGHLASVERAQLQQEALNYLGDAVNAVHGPKPYQMSFQAWETEVRTLEESMSLGATAVAEARYGELVPYYLDDAGLDYEQVYSRIIATAHRADELVPDYARIPWST